MNYQFRATKTGVRICPFFIWTSEDVEGLGHQEDDVNLTFCNHAGNKVDTEGNCQEALCPLIQEQK